MRDGVGIYNPFYPDKGKVKIFGNNLDTSFSIAVDSSAPAILIINNIKPGKYYLQMVAARSGVWAQTLAGTPPGRFEGSYVINLTANVTTHGVHIQAPPKPPAPKKNYLIFYLIGAVVLIAAIGFFIFVRKKR